MPASEKSSDLEKLRRQLSELDSQLVGVISKRVAVVKKVAQLKKTNGIAPVDLEREKALVLKLRAQAKKSGLDEDFVEKLAQDVIAYSKSFYGVKKVAVLGPLGTFSAQAASNYFGDAASLLYCDSFDSVFSRLETREADFAVIPIENNVEGAVNRCVDLLIDSSSKIYAEYYMPISYVLACASSGVKNPSVLYAHPQAFAQCRSFVKKNYSALRVVDASSNGQAVVDALKNKDGVALTTLLSAQEHGAKIIASGVSDYRHNATRFLVLSKTEQPVNNKLVWKTSIVFSLKNAPGALYFALESFARAGIDLTKIESRPVAGHAWEYCFIIDFIGRRDGKAVSKALADVEEKSSFFKVISSYPKA